MLFVLLLLALDLFVFHRKAHEVKIKEAILWTLFWIALSLGFNLYIYYRDGLQACPRIFNGLSDRKIIKCRQPFCFSDDL